MQKECGRWYSKIERSAVPTVVGSQCISRKRKELAFKTLKSQVQTAVVTGCAKREGVCIPKIPTIYSDVTSQFRRLEFPLGLAFAIFINKAQGQALIQMQVFKLGVTLFLTCTNMQRASETEGLNNCMYMSKGVGSQVPGGALTTTWDFDIILSFMFNIYIFFFSRLDSPSGPKLPRC